MRPTAALSKLQVPFDQYQRYGLTALVLKPLAAQLGRPARILEIGCNRLNLLPEFFAPLPVAVTRCDVEGIVEDALDFVVVPREGSLPFADGAFDFVVALEVLEHVPAAARPDRLTEWARVAAGAMLFSCPIHHPLVCEAEQRAQAAYRERTGRPHPFLHEHEEFVLPRADEVADILKRIGVSWFHVHNTPVSEWLPLLLLSEELNELANPDILRSFNQMWNVRNPAFATDHLAYRHLYVCTPTAAAAAAAERAWLKRASAQSGDEPAGKSLDPVALLAGRLRAVFTDHWHAMKTAEASTVQLQTRLEHSVGTLQELRLQHEQLGELQLQTDRALEETAHRASSWETRARAAEFERDELRSAPLLAWLGRARIRLRHIFSKTGVESAHYCELRPLRDGWLATGADPNFTLQQGLHPGWVRIELVGLFPEQAMPKIYCDEGHGYHETAVIPLGPWPGGIARRVFYHRLAKPVRAIRFDPQETPGPFKLLRLRVRNVSGVRAALHRLKSKALGSLHWLIRRLPRPAAASRQALRIWRGLRRRVHERLFPAPAFTPDNYADWLKEEAAHKRERVQEHDRSGVAADRPSFALLLPAFAAPPAVVERTLASIAKQDAAINWSIVLAVAPGKQEAARSACERAGLNALQYRLVEVPRKTSPGACLNLLLRETDSDFILPVDAGDRLAADALLVLPDALAGRGDIDFAYSDEDHEPPGQARQTPDFKPDWSPDYLLEQPYAGRLAAYRAAAVRERGGFAAETADATEYDMQLRLTDATGGNVLHIPRVLYHRGEAATARRPSAAAQRVSARRQEVEMGTSCRTPRARQVSIIIPSAGRPLRWPGRDGPAVVNCVASIRRRCSRQPLEIIVVSNGELPAEAADALRRDGVRLLRYDDDFNFSRSINLGAAAAGGEYLLLLNDDTEVHTPDFLTAMLDLAARPGVGAVGAKLLFPDGRVQHAGVLLNDGRPVHPWYGFSWLHRGYQDSMKTVRNFLAVTGACLLTPREAFRSVQGFDLAFPVSYNDVDFCLRLRDRGYRSVFTPHAVLLHYEGSSRDTASPVQPWELTRFRERWAARYPRDPFYNDNLSPKHIDYQLRRQANETTEGSSC
jgi:GT2 family glycosyltransferase